MYIQIISELGLVGLISFGALIWYIIGSNFRLRKRLKAAGKSDHAFMWISYAITCSIGALFVTSVFGHSLFRAHWYVCGALTAVMMTLTDQMLNSGTAENPSPQPFKLPFRLDQFRKKIS